MLKQQSFPETPESPVTVTQYPEDTYTGTCSGEPCFTQDTNGLFGVCTISKNVIMLELAKRQKLCDWKESLPCGSETDQPVKTPLHVVKTPRKNKTKPVTKKPRK